jgi:hypothetical protein
MRFILKLVMKRKYSTNLSSQGSSTQPQYVEALSPSLGLLKSQARLKPAPSPGLDQAQLERAWLSRLRALSPAQPITNFTLYLDKKTHKIRIIVNRHHTESINTETKDAPAPLPIVSSSPLSVLP